MTLDIQSLEQEVAALPATYNFKMPLYAFTGEGVDMARFIDKRWANQVEPGTQVVRMHGLESAKDKLSPEIRAEVLWLIEEIQKAHTAYLLAASAGGYAGKVDRAHFLIDELSAVLEFLFDDGVEDEKDAKLAKLKSAHERLPEGADASASVLADYVALASAHRAEIAGLGGFDVALIDESSALIPVLRALPQNPLEQNDQEKAHLARRNQLLQALEARMARVRTAAKYIFRKHPEIVRESTSVYLRRQRAEQRRTAAKQARGADVSGVETVG